MRGENPHSCVTEVVGTGVPVYVSDVYWSGGWWRVAVLMRRPTGNRAAIQPRFRAFDDATVLRLAVRELMAS